MNGPPWSSHLHERFTKITTEFCHLKFEKSSRATRSQFLKSFAFPDEVVQLQQSRGKQRREPVSRWFGDLSPLCRSLHLSSPDVALLRLFVTVFRQRNTSYVLNFDVAHSILQLTTLITLCCRLHRFVFNVFFICSVFSLSFLVFVFSPCSQWNRTKSLKLETSKNYHCKTRDN